MTSLGSRVKGWRKSPESPTCRDGYRNKGSNGSKSPLTVGVYSGRRSQIVSLDVSVSH